MGDIELIVFIKSTADVYDTYLIDYWLNKRKSYKNVMLPKVILRDVGIFQQGKSLTSATTQFTTMSGLTCLKTVAARRLAANRKFSSSRPVVEVF